MRVVLASKSPARRATLRAAGINAAVEVSGVDERAVLVNLENTSRTQPDAATQVLALARAKARAVAAALCDRQAQAGPAADPDEFLGEDTLIVIGCDSMLEMGGEMLGKPHTPDKAVKRIRQMRGREALLWSGHTVVVLDRTETGDARGQHPASQWSVRDELGDAACTRVRFGQMSNAEIDAYVATGEPLNVAGSFTIDGFGGPFIEGIDGDHHNVVGISLPLVRRMLARLGIFWPDLWEATANS